MSKRKKVFILILIVVLLILTIISTYSKYISTGEGKGTKKIAQWIIKINGTDISTSLLANDDTTNTTNQSNEASFVIDDFTWDWDGEPHVKEPKVAPGMKGHFSLNIDLTGTEVSAKYTIKIEKNVLTELADINLQITGLKENGVEQPLKEDENGNVVIEKIKTLDKIQSSNEDDRIDNLEIEITWKNDDTEESNKADSEIGSVANRKIEMPVKVHVIQYIGEILDGT